MSKQVKPAFTLTQFAQHVGEWAVSRATTNAMHAVLREYAPDRLSKAERVEVDKIVVRVIGKAYGVTATQAVKNGRLSMLCFSRAEHADDAEEYALYHRAAQALNAARNRFIEPSNKVPEVKPATTAQIIMFATKRNETKNDEPVSASERQEIRRAMVLLAKLIN